MRRHERALARRAPNAVAHSCSRATVSASFERSFRDSRITNEDEGPGLPCVRRRDAGM